LIFNRNVEVHQLQQILTATALVLKSVTFSMLEKERGTKIRGEKLQETKTVLLTETQKNMQLKEMFT
jgi:hypothetical protein